MHEGAACGSTSLVVVELVSSICKVAPPSWQATL